MDRLTNREYWDTVHATLSRGRPVPGRLPVPSRLKALLKKLLGPKVIEYTREYRDYLLWDVIYPRFLPRRSGGKVLEVGSAPGHHLVQLRKVFGLDPYGVEYSPKGVAINRKVFEEHGINPDNVIEADFFSPEFQTRYETCFHVVISQGFIEHFTDVESVVSKHLNVLLPGGYLVVTIPNLQGVNYLLARAFRREVIPLHNLSIMRRDAFCRLFARPELTGLLCDYYGTFSFGLFNTRPDSMRRHLLRACDKGQRLLNAIFRLFFGAGGAETRLFSPNLIFIGVKRG